MVDLCVPTRSVHSRQQLRSTASGTLLVPHARTATGQRSFAVNGPRHGTVCQPILQSATSRVTSRPTCFSSSLRCCWQVGSGSAPFVWRRCDCLASPAPFTNVQTYLVTYLHVTSSAQLLCIPINCVFSRRSMPHNVIITAHTADLQWHDP